MPRVYRVLFICFAISAAFIFSAQGAKIKIKAGLVRSTLEKGPGVFLPDTLKRLKVESVDLTEKFRAGEYAFKDINVLIIETNAMNDAAINKIFYAEEMKAQVEAFVAGKGVIIEFPQPVAKEGEIKWLPLDRYTKRVDVQNPAVFIDENGRDYRLFREVSTKTVEKRLLMSADYGWAPVNGFSGWRAFFAPAYADANKDTASVLETNIPKGRIILLTVPFDNLPGDNLPPQKVKGMQILTRNLMSYCEDILNESAPVYVDTPSVIAKIINVSGFVFEDSNQNGIRDKGERGVANAFVSSSLAVEKTNTSGAYSMTVDQTRTSFLTVCAPSGYWPLRGQFYFRPNYRIGSAEEQKIDMPLVQAPATKLPNYLFIHCNDFSIRDEASAYNFLEDVKELNSFQAGARFVFLTGNMIMRIPNNPTPRKEYELAAKILKNLKLPLYTAVGNQDWGPELTRYSEYEEFRGPRFYSFEYGNAHFMVLDSWAMSPEINAAFQKEAELVGKEQKKSIIVLQQSPVNEPTLKFFAENGVSAVFCGQLMSNRENGLQLKDSKLPPIFECGTSSFSYPGIDRTPRGFRLVSVSPAGIQTDYRVSGVKQNLKITYPQPDARIGRGYVPIVVNAYDTGNFVNRVECTITGPNGVPVLFRGNLKRVGDWTWISDGLWGAGRDVPENCKITVKAVDSANRIWSTEGAFSLSASAARQVALGEDWAQFKKDELHAGSAAGSLKPPLDLLWATHAGGLTHISSPVVSGGTVFVGTQYLTSLAGNAVVAIDAASGKVKWRFPADSAIKHTVGVKDGIVAAQSAEGILYGLDAITGREKWKYEINRPKGVPLTNSIAIDKNTVYAGDDARFIAVRLKDGEYMWDIRVEHHPGISVADAPGVWDDSLLVPFRYGMMKLEKDSGSKEMLREWNPEPQNGPERERIPVRRTPVIVENIMYASYLPGEPRLCAYDLDKNQFIWISPLPVGLNVGEEISSPAVSDGIVVTGTAKGEVAGIEAATGKVVWQFQTKKNIASFIPGIRVESSVTSSPAICNGVAYIGSNDGILYAFDIKTGDIVWKFDIGCPITGSPAISGNALFVTAYDGTVYAFTGQ